MNPNSTVYSATLVTSKSLKFSDFIALNKYSLIGYAEILKNESNLSLELTSIDENGLYTFKSIFLSKTPIAKSSSNFFCSNEVDLYAFDLKKLVISEYFEDLSSIQNFLNQINGVKFEVEFESDNFSQCSFLMPTKFEFSISGSNFIMKISEKNLLKKVWKFKAQIDLFDLPMVLFEKKLTRKGQIYYENKTVFDTILLIFENLFNGQISLDSKNEQILTLYHQLFATTKCSNKIERCVILFNSIAHGKN